MEMERLRDSNLENDRDVSDKPSFEQEPRWYLSGRSELKAAQKLLNGLREDVAKNADLHLEEWKGSIKKTFGDAFYDTIAEWKPVRPDAVLMAEQLAAHAEQFNAPLPGIDRSKRDEAVLEYGRARWEMILKLIDLKLHEIVALSSLNRSDTEIVAQQRDLAIDAISRHITSAARELERSIDWYQDLLDKGM